MSLDPWACIIRNTFSERPDVVEREAGRCDGHAQVHVAYQTSGCIAVRDHDVVRHLDFVNLLASSLAADNSPFIAATKNVRSFLSQKKPGQVHPCTFLGSFLPPRIQCPL